jgi:hypothetical protein
VRCNQLPLLEQPPQALVDRVGSLLDGNVLCGNVVAHGYLVDRKGQGTYPRAGLTGRLLSSAGLDLAGGRGGPPRNEHQKRGGWVHL